MKVEHPKYKDRHVFGAGINLTHLYHGRIPFLWYLERDLGYVNKLYRGLALPDDAPPDEFGGQTIEKPWIAAVEILRHRRPLPDSAGGRLRAGREDRVHDPAGAQGGHHSRRRQHAAAALRRRPHRPAGDPVRAAAGMRQPGRPADLRRDRRRPAAWTRRSSAW